MTNLFNRQIIARLLISISFAFVIITGLAYINTVSVGAVNKADVCEGIEFTGGSCVRPTDPDTGEPVDEVGGIIATVINILSLIVGVVSVIMIIIGGLKYITSAGDANSAKSAKDTILYAVIGLVVVAMAQVIVRFVLTRLPG